MDKNYTMEELANQFQEQNNYKRKQSAEPDMFNLHFTYDQTKEEDYNNQYQAEQNNYNGGFDGTFMSNKKVKLNPEQQQQNFNQNLTKNINDNIEYNDQFNQSINLNSANNESNDMNNYLGMNSQQQLQQQQSLNENIVQQPENNNLQQQKSIEIQKQNSNQGKYGDEKQMLYQNQELFKSNSNKGTYVNKINQIMGAHNMLKIYMDEGESDNSNNGVNNNNENNKTSNENLELLEQIKKQAIHQEKKENGALISPPNNTVNNKTGNKKEKKQYKKRQQKNIQNNNNIEQDNSQEITQANQQNADAKIEDQQAGNNNNKDQNVDPEDELNEKLEKNRESARNSRIRKKIYIELLESKVLKLTEELEVTKANLAEKDNYLSKIQFQTKLLDKYYSGQEQFFEKLDDLLHNQRPDQAGMNMLIDSLRLRMGVSGKERKDAMNYFFKQYLDIAIPQHLRYLMWAASEEKDMFATQEEVDKPEWRQKLLQILQASKSQNHKIQKFKQLFTQERQQIDDILGNILKYKSQLLSKMYTIEFAADEMRELFSPLQIGSFMNFLHRNEFCNDYAHAKLWNSIKDSKDFYFEEEIDQYGDYSSERCMQKIFNIGKKR